MNELTKIADIFDINKGLNFRESHGYTEFY